MMKIGPKSQAQEPVERNMLVVYNSQIDKILAHYPKFPACRSLTWAGAPISNRATTTAVRPLRSTAPLRSFKAVIRLFSNSPILFEMLV